MAEYKVRSSPHSKRQRIAVGKLIYEGMCTVSDAAIKYNVSFYTARTWLRLYKSVMNIKK